MRLSSHMFIAEEGEAKSSAVSLACNLLSEGNVIALPTDTIYGLAACAQNTAAVQKLYGIKGRDSAKPLAVCVGEVNDVSLWGKADNLPDGLLKSLLPGPVTVILERTSLLNPELNPNCLKVGIRVPNHSFVREIALRMGTPLALTSANLSNEPSSLCPQEFQSLWPQLGAVFDGGALGSSIPCSPRAGSTVVDLSLNGMYQVIRDGSALSQTIEILSRYGLRSLNYVETNASV